MRTLGDLLHLGDVDALVREVDDRCAREDHAGVKEVLEGCREATLETGRQLWGPAQYAAYRLALEAPAPLAAEVVEPGAARFALGPLTEVVAQRHTFGELAPFLDGPVRAPVAQERILRGEDLSTDPRADLDDVGLPGRLQPWEPDYPVPSYRPTERLEPGPPPPDAPFREVEVDAGRPRALPALAAALSDLVAPWQEHSEGAVEVATVAGGPAQAVAALVGGTCRMARLTLPEVMAQLAWAGASGGAYGRRRGGAAGRAGAWWVAHAAGGLGFPAEPDEIEYHLEELEWFLFEDGAEGATEGEDAGRGPGDGGDGDGAAYRAGARTGWDLRVVVAGPGWAAALDAHDRRDPGAG